MKNISNTGPQGKVRVSLTVGQDRLSRKIFFRARKSGGQERQKQGVIVILDDEPLLRTSTARAVRTGTARKVLTAETVEEAMGQIENNPVSLIILDRKLKGGIWGDEVISRILNGKEPQKALCVVMYTSSPDKVKEEIREALGEDRIFDKPGEMHQLIALVRHLSEGGEMDTWEKLKPEDLPQSKPPSGRWGKSKLKL